MTSTVVAGWAGRRAGRDWHKRIREELTWSTGRTFAKEDPEDVTKFFYPRSSAYAELRTARSVQQA